MNAREFYTHLRTADLRAPATPEELAKPAGPGVKSTSPFENVMGYLTEATSVIGQLLQLIALGNQIIKQKSEGQATHPLESRYNQELANLGITSAVEESDVAATEEVSILEGRARRSRSTVESDVTKV